MLFDTEKIKELLRESPGLTGKQIAKTLGYADKSALNSFLYSHAEGLKRVEWKWYVDDEYVLVLDGDAGSMKIFLKLTYQLRDVC
jgi:hypothetical protein